MEHDTQGKGFTEGTLVRIRFGIELLGKDDTLSFGSFVHRSFVKRNIRSWYLGSQIPVLFYIKKG